MNTTIPELSHGEGSWVVTKGADRFELFNRRNVERCANAGWIVETIGTYLARIAREVKTA